MNQRLDDAATQNEAYAPIPRIALYDIGYPQSDDEFKELGGYAVLLITAVSQQQDELPLKRVYVLLDGKEIDLKPISSVLSTPSSGSKTVVDTFGAYRSDDLYLLPVYLRLKSADLLIDFAKNRLGFKIATFGTPVSTQVGALHIGPPTVSRPAETVLQAFIKREFPGFSSE
jgi:hypothetical protein